MFCYFTVLRLAFFVPHFIYFCLVIGRFGKLVLHYNYTIWVKIDGFTLKNSKDKSLVYVYTYGD